MNGTTDRWVLASAACRRAECPVEDCVAEMADEHHKHEGCHDLLGNLSAYLDGELEARLCAEIEAHLTDCGNCRIVVDTLRKTILLYHELGQETGGIPEDVEERLYRRLDLSAFER